MNFLNQHLQAKQGKISVTNKTDKLILSVVDLLIQK